jgi:hypothetical protein
MKSGFALLQFHVRLNVLFFVETADGVRVISFQSQRPGGKTLCGSKNR